MVTEDGAAQAAVVAAARQREAPAARRTDGHVGVRRPRHHAPLVCCGSQHVAYSMDRSQQAVYRMHGTAAAGFVQGAESLEYS